MDQAHAEEMQFLGVADLDKTAPDLAELGPSDLARERAVIVPEQVLRP